MAELLKNCRELYVPAAIGGVFLCVADLLQNDKQGQIVKVGDVIQRNFLSPALGVEAMLGLGVILLFSVALCWVFRPPNRAEAFARGASVFAVLAALVPASHVVNSLSDGRAEAAPRGAALSMIASAHAADVRAVLEARIEIEGANEAATRALERAAREEGIIVRLRDASSGRVVGEERTRDTRVTVRKPPGRYLLELELDGYRRANAELDLAEPYQVFRVRLASTSAVPLSLQRLIPPARAKATLDVKETTKLQGASATRRGDYAVALQRYDKALEIDPRDAQTLNYRGYALFRQGDLDQAAAALDRAVSLRPDYFIARLNVAKVACARDENDRARTALLGEPPLRAEELERALGDAEFRAVCPEVTAELRKKLGAS